MKIEQLQDIKNKWLGIKAKYGADCIRYIPLPVICAGSLADAEYITDELSRFIYGEKLLEKTYSGHEDYLVCPASYTGQTSRNFPLIQDIYHHIRSAGGYYGAYRGIILIDVSEWTGHFREKYFDVLLSYLADLCMNGIVPFFYADGRKTEEELPVLSAVISSYFRSVQICFGVKDLYEYADSLISERGVLLDESAADFLEGFIREAARSPLFHGSESVEHICECIVSGSRQEMEHNTLNGQCLKELITVSGYMELYKERSIKTMGFR